MTNEEQTDWLCRLRAYLNNGVIVTPWNKEFTEAITDILEQTDGEDRIITELENIKESIKEIKGDNKYVVSDYMYGRYQAFDVVFDIIKDRIAELNGEQE